jgi:gamma-glutamyl hercynylcysteine S-oxide synthase
MDVLVGQHLKASLAAALAEARRRTLDLLDLVSDEDLVAQHSTIMSPLVWDLAHIGFFEELWLVRRVGGEAPILDRDDVYDAFQHARSDRPELPLLQPADALAYVAEVRERALAILDRIELDPDDELLRDGFVYALVAQHEHQHAETMLATLNLREGTEYPLQPVLSGSEPLSREELMVEGGPFVMGTDRRAGVYDNERPAHEVDVPSFWIDRTPVANADFLAFVEDEAYDDPRWWTEAGWEWRREANLEHPQFWRWEGGRAWSRVRLGRREELPPGEAVQHVGWYEADAFARWAGKRLPTEAEWEKAAPSLELVGEVWEWTSSDFVGYPGFRAFPYSEYSEVFFGTEHKVLRGGSWATHPSVARPTFRNWDFPIRRQIFAGLRCARDA